MDEIIQNLKIFKKYNFFQKGISLYFTNYFELKKTKIKILEYFNMIDIDKDGLISVDELTKAYRYKVIIF